VEQLKQFILPRLTVIFYYLAWVVNLPFYLLNKLFGTPNKLKPVKLCIDAGSRGWESIEFKELYLSAVDYLDESRVHKSVYDREDNYITHVMKNVSRYKITHYFYDARTGSQEYPSNIFQAFAISIIFSIYGVTPIVYATDLAYRRWRIQSAIVSCLSGTVVAFMSAREMHGIFPHGRMVSPSIMPFSRKTLEDLDEITPEKSGVHFIGSLYEPRTTILKSINEILSKKDVQIEVRGRVEGEDRCQDEVYWRTIKSAQILFTTANQIEDPENDYAWITHVLYRYTETLACGTFLIAMDVPGIRKLYAPGVHYIAYESNEDAAEKILYYLENEEERERIMQAGHQRAKELINTHRFWSSIDTGLGSKSMY
jgi:glycosyltransferase involved in cell wall biosynthesis